MADDLNLSMFRAYDIRTPSALLTPELSGRLARAEARYFRDVLDAPGVVIAHDARSTGPRHLTMAADAYRDAGLEVVVLPGVSSTSLFYYAAMRHPDLAAVMFGASHNPAGDTGRKLLAPGVLPIAREIGPEGGLDRIQELYRDDASTLAPRRGSIRAVELIDDYVAFSMELAGVEPGGLGGVRVFQDYLFGAAGREMMLAFGRAGAELAPLHFAADGAFPLGDPNPVKRDVIAPGLAAMRSSGALLGMFFDGDGDRLDVYRGDGTYLSSSFVYAAIMPEIRRRHPGEGLGVFADLKSNPLAIVEMARCGVAVDVIRNGHSQIKESLARDPARFGAVEESAHFYEAFPLDGGRYCTENTLAFALRVARVWGEAPERFERLFEIQGTTAREREWGYKFPDDASRAAALDAVRESFEGQGFRSLSRMKNGMDLEATLMRWGLPLDVDEHTQLADDWLQVCQRISQSEDGLARWEVSGATPELVAHVKRRIAAGVAGYGAGSEYQG
ncbi:phosphoglucomutase [Paludisphaera soli]|uniref:phosphoglucomutase n=1 Tax=Paludisphaera soli TaxID=2712865 RepID=UPI0013EAE153|nr:phosphoglucomutase [Paludisphaera soli]